MTVLKECNMKKYIAWTAVALLTITGFAILLHAQAAPGGEGHRWGHGRGMMMGRIARELNLTDAQKAQIKEIWQAEKPTVQPLMQQLADGRKQMLAATAKGQFDQAQVQSIATQQAQVLTQLMVERAKVESKVYALLTPEQKTKAEELRQKHLDRMGHFGEKGFAPKQ
jgi:protein CpxP